LTVSEGKIFREIPIDKASVQFNQDGRYVSIGVFCWVHRARSSLLKTNGKSGHSKTELTCR
jgi:hypothetical protein